MAPDLDRPGTPPGLRAAQRHASSAPREEEPAPGPGCGSEAGDEPDERTLDPTFMEEALAEARRAYAEDEVPIGAVVLHAGRIVARAHNETRDSGDPTAHAEMLAIRRAAEALRNQRLVGATVYTTVEPCFMCAGALVHARVERVVWAVRDPKFGGAASLGHTLEHPGLNHRVRTAEGSRAEEARELLQSFFRNKR